MQIFLILDPAKLWRWHLALIDQLAASPAARITVIAAEHSGPISPVLDLALRLDAAAGSRGQTPFDVLSLDDIDFAPAASQRTPDLIVDLAATRLPIRQPTVRTLLPLFDGVPGESHFWSHILRGRPPVLALYDTAGPVIPIGLPAIESPHHLRASAGTVATRLLVGLVRAARTATAAHTPSVAAPSSTSLPVSLAGPAAIFIARKAKDKALRVLDRAIKTAPRWAVAWRMRPTGKSQLVPGTTTLDLADWTLLPDDGARFYADPFAVANGDSIDVFVEEFPYATNRGIISWYRILPDGRATMPRPVLATGHHLSYPQVFDRDGETWMLPEQCASGGLILYRARRYPDDWKPVARLIDEPVHDATLFEHDGRLWITATTQGRAGARWGSSWDGLSLFSAQTLLGPWTPHPANPVLIDVRCARPAGALFSANGILYRPVQDCSRAYGSALQLAQITTLNGEAFTQTVVSRLAFSRASRVLGPHTLNRVTTPVAQFEVIDLFARPSVLRAAQQADVIAS